jgi:hypothetical protein
MPTLTLLRSVARDQREVFGERASGERYRHHAKRIDLCTHFHSITLANLNKRTAFPEALGRMIGAGWKERRSRSTRTHGQTGCEEAITLESHSSARGGFHPDREKRPSTIRGRAASR